MKHPPWKGPGPIFLSRGLSQKGFPHSPGRSQYTLPRHRFSEKTSYAGVWNMLLAFPDKHGFSVGGAAGNHCRPQTRGQVWGM